MRIRQLLVYGLVMAPLWLAAVGASAAPKVGEPAPEFVFVGEGGIPYRLAEHVGKRGVVVAWFPKAFTRG